MKPADIMKHKRLIWKLAYKRWYCLPRDTQRWVDVEDLFSESLIKLVERVSEYDAAFKESTWVGMVAESAMADVVKRHRSCKRVLAGEELELDNPDSAVEIPVSDPHFADVHAEQRVEAFLQLASDASVTFLRTVVSGGFHGRVHGAVPEDFKWAVQRSSVTVEDLVRCRAALVY